MIFLERFSNFFPLLATLQKLISMIAILNENYMYVQSMVKIVSTVKTLSRRILPKAMKNFIVYSLHESFSFAVCSLSLSNSIRKEKISCLENSFLLILTFLARMTVAVTMEATKSERRRKKI